MKGNAFIGVSPENERWSLDGQKCILIGIQIMNWELVLIYWKTDYQNLASPNEAAFRN
jgi:hypothetical protein